MIGFRPPWSQVTRKLTSPFSTLPIPSPFQIPSTQVNCAPHYDDFMIPASYVWNTPLLMSSLTSLLASPLAGHELVVPRLRPPGCRGGSGGVPRACSSGWPPTRPPSFCTLASFFSGWAVAPFSLLGVFPLPFFLPRWRLLCFSGLPPS